MAGFDLRRATAEKMDEQDAFNDFRSRFHIPQKNSQDVIYFCGNSLGLQPKQTRDYIEQELLSWETRAVEGHFTGDRPWVDYHELTKSGLCKLLGTKPTEVVTMGGLTYNLHLLLTSFYNPTAQRNKILIESQAFPSDFYAVESQMTKLGISRENLIILKATDGDIYETEEIVSEIKRLGQELALVLWPGVQYYTGQFFDLQKISKAAHAVGAYAGFDLAHAIGNLPLKLHEWQADFATWCTYKYLNSGPGGVSGIFVHEKHASNPDFPKLTGWWGHERKTRFDMDNHFKAAVGADAWMLSNSNILSHATLRASLELFEKADILALRKKSISLTGYLEFLLSNDPLVSERLKIITPKSENERGCQLSVFVLKGGKSVFDELIDAGVVLDWREPNVIRVAPTPLYNSFTEVWRFYSILRGIFTDS